MDPVLASARAQAGLHGKTGLPFGAPVFDRQNTPIRPLPAGWMTWEAPLRLCPEARARPIESTGAVPRRRILAVLLSVNNALLRDLMSSTA
jgi:hypothetical protein